MKIEMIYEGNKICIISADVDLKQAIAAGEEMPEPKFHELFAISIIDEILTESKTSEEAAVLYEMIKMWTEDAWIEHIKEDLSKDNQEEFNVFFGDFVTTKLQFIPLLND